MKYSTYLILIAFFSSLSLISFSQNNNWETKTVSKIEMEDQNTGKWIERIANRRLEFGISPNKDLSFSDEGMIFLSLMAGKEYMFQYDEVYFESQPQKSFENNVAGYPGKLKLLSKNNFTVDGDAFAYFYYSKDGRLGIVEVRNKIGNCAVRFWVNN